MKAFLALILTLASYSVSQAAPLKPGGHPIRVVSIEQFANLMPPIMEPGPTIRTRVKFIVESCTTYTSEQFSLGLTKKQNLQLIKIEPDVNLVDCMGPTHQYELTLETRLLDTAPIVVLNPVLVEKNFVY